MDIKPSKTVLDLNADLILINWEQSGAARYTLAPDADGTSDVEEAGIESPSREDTASAVPELAYRNYRGTHRGNLAWNRSHRNFFPI